MKNVKKIIGAALITILATSLNGCNMIEKTPKGIAKSVVAKAFDAKITKGQVDEQLVGVIKQFETQYGANYKTNAEAMAELTKQKQQVVEGMITEKIVDYKAEELKLMPTEAKLNEETNKQLAEIKKSLGTDAKYKEALAQTSLTEESLKARIKPSIIQDALFTEVTKNVKVTEAQEKAYYDANPNQFTEKPNTIHAAHILVATEPEAIAIKKRLDAGEDFAKVAKEKGTDGTKDNGGDLGDVEYNDAQMDKTFMAAAIALPKGKISAPVKTQYGWHIIKTIEKKEYPVKKFTAVKAEVEKTLITQGKESAWTEAMTKWKKEANIKQYPKNL
ncbi:peptidylprolyl isomerase [Clostridium sp. CM028]|uniref:peptidylprolyl isomerase n=1 Tax=unclassified Clostridium TaxID=2614128 RepID=UPI001C6E4F27|nr:MULTISPECIES: peptidylprolyl isomerase [unclassified Clostridium]MBW9145048.1 peptidylprolyl isomerase [Clostridium sp. CM027]MBW9148542.1 peptidylprolyl isomerase [Clostridium sp. CM028]UVE40179.1 peptidylprolyl isomerase [Clostridium sp. CM027]WLC60859.1 peptidylprolyl isomerase [Clostridium sp. CM028]